MSGTVAQWGASAMVNHITGQATPVVASAAPTWVPGLSWIDSASSYTVMAWNGSAWVAASSLGKYIALLTSDPSLSGPGGGWSVNISDLVEDTTSGYSRQSVTFEQIAASGGSDPASYPAGSWNTNTLSFGPYSANQAAPVQWAALVTCASGTSGLLLYTWILSTPEQVQTSQLIQIPPNDLTLTQA